MAPILSHGQTTSGQCGFNQVASHPADPMKRHRARRERRHPKAMLNTQTSAVALDLLENSITSIGKGCPHFGGFFPRLDERYGVDGTEPGFALAPIAHPHEGPALGAAIIEIEPAAVGMTAGFCERCDGAPITG